MRPAGCRYGERSKCGVCGSIAAIALSGRGARGQRGLRPGLSVVAKLKRMLDVMWMVVGGERHPNGIMHAVGVALAVEHITFYTRGWQLLCRISRANLLFHVSKCRQTE